MGAFFSFENKFIPASIRKRLRGRTELNKIVSNTGWLLTDTIIQIVTNLFVGIWVARYLGPEQRGVMIYANSYISLFIPLTALGLGAILIRELVKDPDAKNELLGTVFYTQLFSYLFFLPLCVGLIFFLRPGQLDVQLAVIILALGSLFQTSRVFSFWFQSKLLSKYTVWATRTVEFIVAGLKIILLVSGSTLMAFIVVIALQMLINFLAQLFFYFITGERIRLWKYNFARMKFMLKDAWPLAISLFAITLYVEIDNIMLGQLLDNQAVGIYGEATRISKMWYFIPAAIATSVYPVLVRSRQTLNLHQYNRRVQQFLDILVLVAYISAIPASILAPTLVKHLYGPAYTQTGQVLAIYVWIFIFVSLREGMNRWLMIDNYTLYAMWTAIIGVIVNIILNFILVPRYGIFGAAWGTLISNGFSIFIMCSTVPKLRPILRHLILAVLAPFRLRTIFLKG